MTIRRYYSVSCDVCCFVELEGDLSSVEAFGRARRSGWRCTPTEDICSECLSKGKGSR